MNRKATYQDCQSSHRWRFSHLPWLVSVLWRSPRDLCLGTWALSQRLVQKSEDGCLDRLVVAERHPITSALGATELPFIIPVGLNPFI